MRCALLTGLIGLTLVQMAGCPETMEVTVPGVQVTTSLGEFVIQLDPDAAPESVSNFLGYVNSDFYDGTVFHRVVADSHVEVAGLLSAFVQKEGQLPIINESSTGLINVRGTVAMARTDEPDSATSQFYVNLADNADLDTTRTEPGYAVFGRVVDGMDVVDAIGAVPTEERDDLTDVPVDDVLIEGVARVDLTIGSTTVLGVRVDTSLGSFVVQLYPVHMPTTVENFLQYVDDGFYAGTLFHRVVPDFVVQGGGLTSDLVEKETQAPIANESFNAFSNLRGTISMVWDDEPDSATTQFLINTVDNPDLDATEDEPGYAVFGRVVDGMDVVDEIAAVPTESRDGLAFAPLDDITIEGVERTELTVGDTSLSAVRVETTLGEFVIELYADYTPVTVENFLQYVDEGYYPGTVVHGADPELGIAAGAYVRGLVPLETGLPVLNESDNGLRNVRGTIAMVYPTAPDTATAHFLVNVVDNTGFDATPWTPGFAVFGEVTEGMDVVDAIASVTTASRGDYVDVPAADVVIEDMEMFIIRTGEEVLTATSQTYDEWRLYQGLVLAREVLVQGLGYAITAGL